MQPHPPAPTAEPALGSPDEPAWLIAPARGLLLAATQAGLARLGLAELSGGSPAPLDRAMPALAELAALVASDALREAPETTRTLVFWTPSGPLTLRCLCRRSEGSDAVLVRALPPAAPVAAPAPQDTGATLTKIADRIRAELKARAHRPLAEPAAAEVSSASAGPAGNAAPDHLAKLAHELRTPVAAIASMSEILRDERFGPLADARYADYARSIHDSARHMLAVIESMLQRQDANTSNTTATQPLTFVDLDLNALTKAVAASVAQLASDAGLSLEATLAERLPIVIADQRCVRQILLNLLTNAMKFTPTGGRVGIVTRHEADGSVTLEVSDTGRGMSAADMARTKAGEPPAQPADDTRGQSSGRGLGLPLVHALAAANGAHVEIASTPGAGTRVSLILPPGRVIPV